MNLFILLNISSGIFQEVQIPRARKRQISAQEIKQQDNRSKLRITDKKERKDYCFFFFFVFAI